MQRVNLRQFAAVDNRGNHRSVSERLGLTLNPSSLAEFTQKCAHLAEQLEALEMSAARDRNRW